MPQSSHPELSDDVLLEATRNGDSAAFAELWTRHRRAGLVAARHLGAPSLADDVVSEAYLRIFELVRDGRGPRGAFRPYLYRTIQSIAVDHWRVPEDASDNFDDIPTLTEAGPWEDNAFDRNAAATAFASLTTRWQSVLWYTEVEGMPPREVAKLLGVSPNAVSALAARAREALQSAWVEAHVNRELAEAECRSTLEHLQRYQRGKLTAALSREVSAHLESCDSCRNAAAEFATLNRQLALVLVGVLLGGGSAFTFLGGAEAGAPASATPLDGGATGTSGTESSSPGSTAAASGAAAGGVFGGVSGTLLLGAAVAGALALGGAGIWFASIGSRGAETSAVAAPADASARDADLSSTREASPTPPAPADDEVPRSSREEPTDTATAGRVREQDRSRTVVPSRESAASASASGTADGSGSGSNGSASSSAASARANASADATAGGSASAGATSSSSGSTRSDATAQSAATGTADASSQSTAAANATANAASEAGADAGSDGSTNDADSTATATADAGAASGSTADAEGSTSANGTDGSDGGDPAFSPMFTCWTSHGQPGKVYVYGTGLVGGSVQARVRLGNGPWVQSTENMQVQWDARWWSSNPLPLLDDGVDPASATVQIRLFVNTDVFSPWTTVQLGPESHVGC